LPTIATYSEYADVFAAVVSAQATGVVDYIVTDDSHLRTHLPHYEQCRVVSPAEFLDALADATDWLQAEVNDAAAHTLESMSVGENQP
jgi:hypothetical protein